MTMTDTITVAASVGSPIGAALDLVSTFEREPAE
jgi:hypothetical protein